MANCNYTSSAETVVVIIYVCLHISAIAVIEEEAVGEQQLQVGFQIPCSGMATGEISTSATLPAQPSCPRGSQASSYRIVFRLAFTLTQ